MERELHLNLFDFSSCLYILLQITLNAGSAQTAMVEQVIKVTDEFVSDLNIAAKQVKDCLATQSSNAVTSAAAIGSDLTKCLA